MKKFKISIVTPSFNQGHYIIDTIESILNQNYSNFEHIIIDGGSNDDTLNILKKYKHLSWISEKDKGPANAINKGFKMCTGDIISWLNADDYYDKDVFNTINQSFIKNDTNVIYGNLTFLDINNNSEFVDKTKDFDSYYLIHKNADQLRQPCTFYKRKILEEIGYLDESLKLVFDYDFYIRILGRFKPLYVDKNLVFFRMYNDALTKKNIRKQAIEIYKVSKKYGARFYDPIILNSVVKKLIFPGKF